MIKTESVIINERTFKKTTSDRGFLIQKVGTDEKYAEAIDLLDSKFKYVETNEPIPNEPETEMP